MLKVSSKVENIMLKNPSYLQELYWNGRNKDVVERYLNMTADITKDIVENDLSYKEAEELIGIALRNKFHSNGSKFTIKPHNILEYNSIGAIKCKQKSILTTKRNENNYTDHDESLEIAGEWFKKNPGKMKWALTDLNKTLYLHDPDRIKAEEYAREETKKRKNIKENKA